MDKGTIPINKDFELEYRYYDKDSNFKYFNRRFEIYVLEKKTLKKNYVMHMDNTNPHEIMPTVHKASTGGKKYDFGVTTLNWNDIKIKLADYIVSELGERERENIKKAISKLNSPKL